MIKAKSELVRWTTMVKSYKDEIKNRESSIIRHEQGIKKAQVKLHDAQVQAAKFQTLVGKIEKTGTGSALEKLSALLAHIDKEESKATKRIVAAKSGKNEMRKTKLGALLRKGMRSSDATATQQRDSKDVLKALRGKSVNVDELKNEIVQLWSDATQVEIIELRRRISKV